MFGLFLRFIIYFFHIAEGQKQVNVQYYRRISVDVYAAGTSTLAPSRLVLLYHYTNLETSYVTIAPMIAE